MLRALAPSFVVTLAALSQTGCRASETANPPAPTPSATSVTPSAAAVSPSTPPAPVPVAAVTRKRKRTTDAGRSYGASAHIDYADLEPLNPAAADGRTIYAAGDDSCYTEAPDPRPPKNRPTGIPARIFTTVDCPAAMDDPAWDTCDAQLSRSKGKGACFCLPTMGNPPPPPTPNACPRK